MRKPYFVVTKDMSLVYSSLVEVTAVVVVICLRKVLAGANLTSSTPYQTFSWLFSISEKFLGRILISLRVC